jgi:hypothetical protein
MIKRFFWVQWAKSVHILVTKARRQPAEGDRTECGLHAPAGAGWKLGPLSGAERRLICKRCRGG